MSKAVSNAIQDSKGWIMKWLSRMSLTKNELNIEHLGSNSDDATQHLHARCFFNALKFEWK